MTITVTNSQIQIKNAQGVVKFNSNDKLLYKAYSQTGSITVGSQLIKIPFISLNKEKDILIINVKITSCNGDSKISGPLLNNVIPANGGFIIDFYGRASGTQAAVDTEILQIVNIANELWFKSIRWDANSNFGNGTKTTTLTYYAYVLSYK
jgi:hypothetical protein